MGAIINKFVEDDVHFGLWEITENYDQLIHMVDLDKADRDRLNSFRYHGRKLEWLSVRALLCELNGKGSKIVYNKMRKPFLNDKSRHISVSHSKKITGLLLSQHKKLGIDLEYMSHKISRLAHKFINNHEYITTDCALQQMHLYIHWCAKEALYKVCDKQDINFKQNLTLLPFEPMDYGSITGYVDNKFGHEEFEIQFFTKQNYIIAYTCK